VNQRKERAQTVGGRGVVRAIDREGERGGEREREELEIRNADGSL
jgi:hypothetical protein